MHSLQNRKISVGGDILFPTTQPFCVSLKWFFLLTYYKGKSKLPEKSIWLLEIFFGRAVHTWNWVISVVSSSVVRPSRLWGGSELSFRNGPMKGEEPRGNEVTPKHNWKREKLYFQTDLGCDSVFHAADVFVVIFLSGHFCAQLWMIWNSRWKHKCIQYKDIKTPHSCSNLADDSIRFVVCCWK